MRSSLAVVALLPFAAHATNLVLSNDDGWAESNVRAFFKSLTSAGDSVILSSPATNQSGRASLEATPKTVASGCEFASCPAGSPATGSNSSDPRLNYVNSTPVSAMKYGVQTLAQKTFGGNPDLVVSGPNVGSNLGAVTLISGTVGAASAAADQFGIPGLAFSGSTGSEIAWNVPTPDYALLYADLATNVTSAIIAAGVPYLPNNTYLNVNFPEAGSGTSCTSTADFKFVLSRIFTATLISGKDVLTCGNGQRLPTETKVLGTSGCYASVSVGRASDKRDASADDQAVVLAKLGGLLTCLP